MLLALYYFIHWEPKFSMASTATDPNSPGGYKCEICGLTFASQNNRDKHIELEHEENKRPAGVR